MYISNDFESSVNLTCFRGGAPLLEVDAFSSVCSAAVSSTFLLSLPSPLSFRSSCWYKYRSKMVLRSDTMICRDGRSSVHRYIGIFLWFSDLKLEKFDGRFDGRPCRHLLPDISLRLVDALHYQL